jgi:transcriptional regulator with XRE-family HTH domain
MPAHGSDETVGFNIRTLREAADLSQADLAQRLTEAGVPGVYQTTVSKIESGERSLRFSEGVEIAYILKVAPRDLHAPPDPHSHNGRVLHDLQQARIAQGLFETARQDLAIQRALLRMSLELPASDALLAEARAFLSATDGSPELGGGESIRDDDFPTPGPEAQ